MKREVLIREGLCEDYRPVESLGIKVDEIRFNPKYRDYKFKACDGFVVAGDYEPASQFILYSLKEMTVAHISDEEKKIWLEEGSWDTSETIDRNRKKVRDFYRIKDAREYLATPFAKEWLQKMQYTVKEDEYGHKFLFLAIKCGFNKIDGDEFQQLCDAICLDNFKDSLRMSMWIGGKVNWTMFYQRPDHVNGKETYFCGVVAEDDFSPEDFDRDHLDFSFENASSYL